MGYFIFNGFDSRSFNIEIEEAPKVNKSAQRAETFPVPGRNGNIVISQDAWDDVQITYHCWAETAAYPSYTSMIAERLRSNGYAELYDGYTRQTRLAYIAAPIEFDVVQESFVRFDITFTCRPQIYVFDAFREIEIPVGETYYLSNTSGHDAYPLFHFTGSGTLTITYEGEFVDGHYRTQTLTVFGDDEVYYDCEIGAAYVISGSRKVKSPRVQVSGTDLPILRYHSRIRLVWSGEAGTAFYQTRFWQL